MKKIMDGFAIGLELVLVLTALFSGVAAYTITHRETPEVVSVELGGFAGAFAADIGREKEALQQKEVYLAYREDADGPATVISMEELDFWPLPKWFTSEEKAIYSAAVFALEQGGRELLVDHKLYDDVTETVKLLRRNHDIANVEYEPFLASEAMASGTCFRLLPKA